MRALFLGVALFAGTSIVGCSAILGLQEPTLDNSIGDGGSGGDGGGSDTSTGDGAGGDGGVCTKDCLGGACVGGQCQPVLVASSTSIAPYAMVLDGNTLYFTNLHANDLHSVYKIDKTATNGTPTQLADYAQGYTTPLVDALPYSVAVQGGFFYVSLYANGAVNSQWEAGLDRCATTGCTSNTLAYYGVDSYAVVANASNVFFGSTDYNSVYTIQKANLDMTGRSTLGTSTSEVNGLALDGSDLYYGTADGVFHCTSSACTATALTQGQTLDAELLAVDANNVYFSSTPYGGTQTVQSVARAGGPPKLISNKPQNPLGIATDGTDVYFTDVGDTQTPSTGAVYRCPVAGCNGAEETLSTGAAAGDNPRPVLVDANAIYWGTRGGKIWRLAK
ncbi:MAG TPA: hypothetical protein VLM85_19845 [Polyangiaceae bacterium]|nr:hypothetical protein [Polyangiaceae bacterium]